MKPVACSTFRHTPNLSREFRWEQFQICGLMAAINVAANMPQDGVP